MANPLRDLGISDDDLAREIESNAEVKVEKLKKAKEVAAFAKSIAPKKTGHYAAGIKVQQTKTNKVRVVATAWYSHFIEYGTGPDKKKGSKFGPDTPTPEFAVFAKAAAAFGGTANGVLSDSKDEL